jgi:hypothetical protein
MIRGMVVTIGVAMVGFRLRGVFGRGSARGSERRGSGSGSHKPVDHKTGAINESREGASFNYKVIMCCKRKMAKGPIDNHRRRTVGVEEKKTSGLASGVSGVNLEGWEAEVERGLLQLKPR